MHQPLPPLPDPPVSVMIQPAQLRRLLVLAAVLVLLLSAQGFRLVWLQVLRHEYYRDAAERNTQRLFYREPRRGDILDARGNPLATSVPVKRVLANPRQ